MNNIIGYNEIMTKLSTFKSLKENNVENYQKAKKGIELFKSGVNLSITGYQDDIVAKTELMMQNSVILQEDYDRIITYLTNLAQKAQEAATKSVTTLDARATWNAIETVDG